MLQPVVWNALGYPFEATPMLAGLSACMVVRVWVCLKDAPETARARALNLTVTGIALLFSAGWILLQRPSPFYALLSGCGFGALGSGIIALSLKWVQRIDAIAPAEEPAIHSMGASRDQVEAARASARRAQHTRHKRKH
jgi:hypothetical protein